MIASMTDLDPEPVTRRRPDGPPAGVLGIIVLAFTIASVVAYGSGSMFWNGFFVFAA